MASKPIKYYDHTEWRSEVGLLHRLDGPAIEYDCGDKTWYQNGLLHRLDGPAIEWADGEKQYFMNGKQYVPLFIKFAKIIKKINKLNITSHNMKKYNLI